MMYGKVPPQARELEEAVLGALMLESSSYDEISDILRPEMFYVDGHQRVYKAIQRLSGRNYPVDLLTVVEELRKSEDLDFVGGPFMVTKLTNAVVSSANIEAHARIIVQKFIHRELIRVSSEIIGVAYEDSADAFDVLAFAEENIFNIGSTNVGGGVITMQKVLTQAMNKVEEYRKQDSTVTGISTGQRHLDVCTRGWQNGDLIIIAARPSKGKSAFALFLIKAAADYLKISGKGGSVAVWSLEMKAFLLAIRMIAAESKTFMYKLQTGRFTDQEMLELYNGAVKRLSDLDILFDEDMDITVEVLAGKARRMKKKNNLKLIIVDYLQLLSSSNSKGVREQEVATISKTLKKLAVKLDIPVIALSQMSRDIEKRKENANEPMLSDIRESGAIEQDADIVIFLYGHTDAEIEQDVSLAEIRYAKIAKSRNGVLDKIKMSFKKEFQLFSDLESAGFRPLNNVEQQAINFTESKKENINPEDLPF